MTADRRRKRRVRARAAKTGESYTAALRHLLTTEESHVQTYEINQAGITDIGNVREANEDCFLAEGDLFAVADGMGGLGRGEVASRVAIDALRESFSIDPTGPGLVAAVHIANAAVLEHAETDPELQGMGTTIAAVAAVEDRLAVVNVGDSRVYLFRDGKLSRLSSDHSKVADLVRAGEITDEEAIDHPERHVLTHAIGIDSRVVPHVGHAMPVAGDRVLLCSDGLFNELCSEEIAEILTTVADPAAAVEQLVALAKDNGGGDNITAVVLNIR